MRRAAAHSESLSLSAALLFLFSFLAFFAAFSSFFLRLRSAFSSAVSSSSCLRFLVFSSASPVGATGGAARTSAVEVVSARGADSTSVLLRSLYSAFHLAGVFSLGRPNF